MSETFEYCNDLAVVRARQLIDSLNELTNKHYLMLDEYQLLLFGTIIEKCDKFIKYNEALNLEGEKK